MEYNVADSYKDCERIGEPFVNEKGMTYVKIKVRCDRCGGTGVMASKVENGVIIPIPVDGGICYKCNGAKFLYKDVRAYSEIEYANYKKKQQSQAEAREKSMEENFEANRVKWLAGEGFNAEGKTYIYWPDNSYEIKDKLKEAGFKFNMTLKWHAAAPIEEYKDQLLEVSADEIFTFAAWGSGFYNSDAKNYIQNKVENLRPHKETKFFGEVGEKIKCEKATLSRKAGFESRYGYSNVYTFTKDDYVFVWITTKYLPFEIGTDIVISGTIKEHSEYRDINQTKLTRCKVEEA